MSINEGDETSLGTVVRPLLQAHPDKSGIAALAHGRDAFAARMILANIAERTLDAQYYIWHNDMSGMLLFKALRSAADRGVRVRLLLDDNNTSGLDGILAVLDSHSHIEVRLFNPFCGRRWRALGYLFDFGRLNRRMHNKAFTADNQVTIIGGRNVGDEYFSAGQDLLFVDLDLLAIGPVVNEVSGNFESYWRSQSAYAVGRLLPKATDEMTTAIKATSQRIEDSAAAAAYREEIAREQFLHQMLAGQLPLEWAVTSMVSDIPEKVLERVTPAESLWTRLKKILDAAQHELALVSAYFVPGVDGVDYLVALAQRGIKITILTNSLEATDVIAVQAGYAKRRKALLKGGIALPNGWPILETCTCG